MLKSPPPFFPRVNFFRVKPRRPRPPAAIFLRSQASNVASMMAGMHCDGEVRVWYTRTFASLGEINLPVQVYMLALVHYAVKTQLFGPGSLEDVISTVVLRSV